MMMMSRVKCPEQVRVADQGRIAKCRRVRSIIQRKRDVDGVSLNTWDYKKRPLSGSQPMDSTNAISIVRSHSPEACHRRAATIACTCLQLANETLKTRFNELYLVMINEVHVA